MTVVPSQDINIPKGPLRVTKESIRSLPPLYRALAEVLLERQTGDIVLVDEVAGA
jgi:hypothetical protein